MAAEAAAVKRSWASPWRQMGDYSRALVRIRALAQRSGEVPTETMAEATILEAMIAVQQCRRRDTELVVARFNDVYPILFTEAKRLAAASLTRSST